MPRFGKSLFAITCVPWTVTGATAWLRKSSQDVLQMVEDDRLEWAWDISPLPSRSRREIRVLFRALEACKARQPLPELSPAQVIAAIIGHPRAILSGREVQAILNCDHNQVARDLAAGELARVAVDRARTHSSLLLRQSLVNFLLRRRIR